MTLRELKAELQRILKEKENPQLEARVIIKHLFSLSDVSYILRENEPINADDEKRAIETALERKNGKPSAYILGHREFFGLDYIVLRHDRVPPSLVPLRSGAVRAAAGGRCAAPHR